MRKFLIVTAFALATPAIAHDCPDKVIAAADHLGLNRVESFGATHPTYYLPTERTDPSFHLHLPGRKRAYLPRLARASNFVC